MFYEKGVLKSFAKISGKHENEGFWVGFFPEVFQKFLRVPIKKYFWYNHTAILRGSSHR